MEEDDKKVEEPIVEDDKKLEEEVDYSTTPWFEKPESEWDTDDAAEAKKALQTAIAQKAHWKKKFEKAGQVKAEDKPEEKKKPEDNKEKKPESKKLNTEQVNQSEIVELSRLAARGYSDEDLELLKDIKTLKGYNNLTEATESPLFKANKEQKEQEKKKEKAQLGASNRSSVFKDGKEPTKEDLKKAWLGK